MTGMVERMEIAAIYEKHRLADINNPRDPYTLLPDCSVMAPARDMPMWEDLDEAAQLAYEWGYIIGSG